MPTGERRRGRQRRGIWWEAEAAIARELERRGKEDGERTIHGAVRRSRKVLLLPRARATDGVICAREKVYSTYH
jgi:hypothetical protein